MTQPYNASASSVPGVGEAATLVAGRAFCLSHPDGQIRPEAPTDGFYFADTRFLTRLEVSVDGHSMEPLTHTVIDPHSAVFVTRLQDGLGRQLLLIRRRFVGNGLREDLEIVNPTHDPIHIDLGVDVAADFAHIFSVKAGSPVSAEGIRTTVTANGMSFVTDQPRRSVAVEINPDHFTVDPRGRIHLALEIGGQQHQTVCLQARVGLDGDSLEPAYRCGEPVAAGVPARRLEKWRVRSPDIVTSNPIVQRVFSQSLEDLAALRIFDPAHPERAVVAAGAPWFMTLFGRDSLLTAWMALPFAPELAAGVLLTLAEMQGDRDDPETDQSPGKILHEIRHRDGAGTGWREGDIYYGTVDATPLFVMLVAEAKRWGALSDEQIEYLRPAVTKAVAWMEGPGDLDGDGYLEYARRSTNGLANQGWKDSWDGINFSDGSLPQGPLALAEVQGYAYAAFIGAAELAADNGDTDESSRLIARAERLKQSFNKDFWLKERGWIAVGLDGAKRPIDALASNLGHCLWTGIVDDRSAASATVLAAPDMFSGWGVRTLATSMGAYDPISYHNGSVWPHDTAIAVAGLARWRHTSDASAIGFSLFEAGMATGGRLPELFSGIDRETVPTPVSYPSACAPQAWASASPLLVLRALLGLEADNGRLIAGDEAPSWLVDTALSGLRVGDRLFDVTIDRSGEITIADR